MKSNEDKPKYVTLKEVVDKMLRDEDLNKQFNFWEQPITAEQELIITEDADYEIIPPKSLPASKIDSEEQIGMGINCP